MFSTLPDRYFNFSVIFILLSANAFNLAWSKILSFGKELSPLLTQQVSYVRKRRLTLPLTLFPTQSRLLTTLKQKALENTKGKGENAGNQHFLLFQQCFPLYHTEKSSFLQCLICRLQMLSIWSRPKFCRLVELTQKQVILHVC